MQVTNGQTRSELEEQRRQALEEIEYVDNLLKETEEKKREGLNELRIVGSKLYLRERVLNGLHEEIILLNERIELNNIALNMMESDLAVLKKDYERAIINSYKLSKNNAKIGYILSAKDFNQGYKRLKYLQQISRFRRNETEIIVELKMQIENSRKKLEEDLKEINELKKREERQKGLLKREKDNKERIVGKLKKQEKQLQKELEEKRRIARRIEAEIAKILEEERLKGIRADLTPEQRLISEDFEENKGKFPWPVERGIITRRFGVQQHPVLKYVTENNIDIEITSSGNTPVRCIFKGEVVKVFSIPGANWAIIIRHGKYLSVYQNIINVKVKAGDKVYTKQEIGNVFVDKNDGDKAVLKFMIFEEKTKMDPELWITKKN